MTYRQAFDRLGNPVYRRSETPIGHKIIQRVGLVVSLVCIALMYGVR